MINHTLNNTTLSPDAENMTILKSTRMVGPASGVSSPVHSVINVIIIQQQSYVCRRLHLAGQPASETPLDQSIDGRNDSSDHSHGGCGLYCCLGCLLTGGEGDAAIEADI